MTKGKVKTHGGDSAAPAQPRSLRSRKREGPREELSDTVVQVIVCQENTEGTNSAVDCTLMQPTLQESTSDPTKHHQAAEQPCPTNQEPVTEENPADITDVTVTDFAEQEETTIPNPSNDSKHEGFTVQTETAVQKNEEEKAEITAEECSRSPLELQDGANENSHRGPEKNEETSEEEHLNTDTPDMTVIAKQAASGLPAKKKRRMGMCGLTERERSHFLKTQKRESRQKEPERAEARTEENATDQVTQEEVLPAHASPPSCSIAVESIPMYTAPMSSAPADGAPVDSVPMDTALMCSAAVDSELVDSVSEENEAAIELQSEECRADKRADAEVFITVSTSDGDGTVCDPDYPKEGSRGATGDPAPDPEPAADPKLVLLGERVEEDEEHLSDEREESQIISKNPTKTAEKEDKGEPETSSLEVNDVTMTTDELTGDGGSIRGATTDPSITEIQPEASDCVSAELCEAPATPGGSEENCSRDPDKEPSPSAVNPEPPLSRTPSDPFGPGCLDYVSDSQLNTISLIEEALMERGDALPSSGGHEDASDLLCGLIRELSSLNRKVMVAHRELENLRRNNKSSRSSAR